MAAPTHIEGMTVEAFERYAAQPEHAERRLELLEGDIVEKMPTEEHGYLLARLLAALVIYLQQQKLGLVTTDASHRLPEDASTVLRPDIAYTSFERKAALVRQGAVPLMPDLAVEIKSPSDHPTVLRRKANYYLEHGSRLAWLVMPDRQTVEVYTVEGDLTLLDAEDTLDGGAVLPGFSIAVREIFGD